LLVTEDERTPHVVAVRDYAMRLNPRRDNQQVT
jgi:hypothetical protein